MNSLPISRIHFAFIFGSERPLLAQSDLLKLLLVQSDATRSGRDIKKRILKLRCDSLWWFNSNVSFFRVAI